MPTRRLPGGLARAACVLGAVLQLAACAGAPPPTGTPAGRQLAIINGDQLHVVDPATGAVLFTRSDHGEYRRLVYSPAGDRLALIACQQNAVVALDTATYTPVTQFVQGAARCPWGVAYAPDGQAVALTVAVRPSPTAGFNGHLQVTGPAPLDRPLGRPLSSVAWRPDGAALALITPQGDVQVLGPSPAYAVQQTLAVGGALDLAYSADGNRLLVGTTGGVAAFDVGNGYAQRFSEPGPAVGRIAVDPAGSWVALLRATEVSLRRAPDLAQVHTVATAAGFTDVAFSRDGALLAVAETADQVRLFGAPDWQELAPIALPGRIDAVAFRPDGGPPVPVLFVHGHSGDFAESWFESAADTSFAAALAANPGLGLDAFYLQLPVHGGNDPSIQARSIAADAVDILAAIEGGADSAGVVRVGLLDLPAYAGAGRVALVGYSQGSLSSRKYLKDHMGSRRGGGVTVSTFVALAGPNHGVGGALLTCNDSAEPDRARRQLCAGLTQTLAGQAAPCGQCPTILAGPVPFSTNQTGDATFITDLNGHPLSDSCAGNATFPSETPRSRPSDPGGVLYANLYAADEDDLFVGGGDQSLDCAGRRLARLLSPDAENREVAGTPSVVHANFPHHWPTICTALRSIADGAVPADPAQACTGLTHP
jgi:DNA-binding beta-propeller fold protein YncE